MVRFEDKLHQNAVRDWASHYIDYRRLKQILLEDASGEVKTSSFPSSLTTFSPLRLNQGGLSSSLLGNEVAAAEEGVTDKSRLLEALLLTPEVLARSTHNPNAAIDARFRRALVQEVAKADGFYSSLVAAFAEELAFLEGQAAATQAKHRGRKSAIFQTLTQRHSAGFSARNVASSPPHGSLDIRLAPLLTGDNDNEENRPSGRPGSKARDALDVVDSELAAIDRDLVSVRSDSSRANKFLKSAKRAYVDLYRKLCHLENFCILNYTAIVKAVKKRDKLLVVSDENTKNDAQHAERLPERPSVEYDDLIPLSSLLPSLSSTGGVTFVEFLALVALKARLEHTYAAIFCGAAEELARAELLIKRSEYSSHAPYGDPFRLGKRVGMCMALLVWIGWDILVDFVWNQGDNLSRDFEECHTSAPDLALINSTSTSIVHEWFMKDFPIYRGMMSLVVCLWLWAGLIYAWKKFRINYLFVLDMDPQHSATVTQTLMTAANLTILLLASFIIHFKVLRCEFPKLLLHGSLGLWAIFPFIAILFKALTPWPWRRHAWRAVFDTVAAPSFKVTFVMNYVGDVLTSLIKPLVDIGYTFCFFASGDWRGHLGNSAVCRSEDGVFVAVVTPIILLGPYWFRFMQCCRRYYDSDLRHPHLPNAFKYALSMFVTLFSVFFPADNLHWSPYRVCWTLAYFGSTLYSWGWDVLMDWSAIDLRAPGYLRERRLLAWPGYYYAAIVIDLILRFFWSWTLIPENDAAKLSDLGAFIAPVAALAEILRRAMWSVLRLENEHVTNCAGYRSVAHIPLHFDTVQHEPTDGDEDESTGKRKRIFVEIGLFVGTTLVFIFIVVAYSSTS